MKRASTRKVLAVVTEAVIVKKDAPVYDMHNMLEIEAFFNECILDQPTSIRNLSSTLSAMINGKEKPRTFMITLAGPSDTGKSKTVKRLRHLLGMAPDYQYESLFIEYWVKSVDFGPWTADDDDITTRDGNDIVDRIHQSLKSRGDKQPPPPYVMLFVHNFDQATHLFKLVINSLLCSKPGATSSVLTLPVGTTLLIVCTCHYGEEKVTKMSERYDDVAEMYIRDDMRRGVMDTTIQRIDLLLPYYALSRDVLKQLMGKKFDKYVTASRIVERFGAQALKTAPRMKEMLINHVVGTGDNHGGLRNVERVLKNKLDQLFQAGIAVIDGLQKKPMSDTIYLESSSFDTRSFGELLERELDKVTGEFIKSIKEDPRNQQILANCNPNRAGTVDAVSMRYGEKPLCGLVMNVNYVTINNYYDTQETTKITEKLKARNKKLKGCLIAVNAAVKKEPHGVIGGIIRSNKELFNESSDDSGEEYVSILGKRKAADPVVSVVKKARTDESVTPVVATMSDDDDSSDIDYDFPAGDLVFSEEEKLDDLDLDILKSDEEWEYIPPVPKKKGRPFTEVKGFLRIDSPSKRGRVVWQCTKCLHSVSKIAYTSSHRCLIY